MNMSSLEKEILNETHAKPILTAKRKMVANFNHSNWKDYPFVVSYLFQLIL